MKSQIMIPLVTVMILMYSVDAFCQQTGQQQQQHMQQLQQMQQMQEKMNRMMERTHSMTQEMNRRMEQAQNEQMRNQHQMMYRFSEHLGMTLGNMKNAAERCEMMLRDRDMMRDREMERDMEQMRRHLNDMTEQMEDAIQTMERMARRLRESQTE